MCILYDYKNFVFQALGRNATDAMRESRVPDVLNAVCHLTMIEVFLF